MTASKLQDRIANQPKACCAAHHVQWANVADGSFTTDAPIQLTRLMSAPPQKPTNFTAAKKCRFVPEGDIDQLHSMTSSAVASSKAGTSPSAVAVFRLITRSNFSGRCIGNSLGFFP